MVLPPKKTVWKQSLPQLVKWAHTKKGFSSKNYENRKKNGINSWKCGIYEPSKLLQNLKSKVILETKKHLSVNSTFGLVFAPKKTAWKQRLLLLVKWAHKKKKDQALKITKSAKKKWD